MIAHYHRQITTDALGKHFRPQALEIIIQGNLHQDDLKYLLGAYPHYHFDDNAFDRTYAYLAEQNEVIFSTLAANLPLPPAWEAFGKITHTLQDFYAHSNYVQRWLAQFPDTPPDPEDIPPLLPDLLSQPHLRSGRVLISLEILGMIPVVGHLLRPFFPADTHIRMNLDQPKSGPLFPYAYVAARKRTEEAFKTLTEQITLRYGGQILPKFIGEAE